MPFEPGNTEQKKGDHTKSRRIKQRLIAELEEADEHGITRLAKATKALVDRAIAGDVAAFNAIADRVDGKPAQPVVGGDEDEGGPIRHALTVRFV